MGEEADARDSGEGGGGQGEADPMPDMPEGGMMSPPEPDPQQGFYSGKQGQNFLDIILDFFSIGSYDPCRLTTVSGVQLRLTLANLGDANHLAICAALFCNIMFNIKCTY